MRRFNHQMYVVFGVSVVFLMYLQTLIFIKDHLRSNLHSLKDLDKVNFRLVAEKSDDVIRLMEKETRAAGYPQSRKALDQYVSSQEDTNGTRGFRGQIKVPLNFFENKFLMDYQKALESDHNPPLWQNELYNRTKARSPPKQNFFLTHLLMVRLYSADPAKWTLGELKQWMHYMFLIGVEHIYICDHYHLGDEDMEKQLQQYITLGLVSYSRISTQRAMQAQVQCYKRLVKTEGSKSRWMTSVDMDEYPYHMEDKEENFLHRFLKNIQEEHPDVAEVSLPNFLMLGQGDRTRNMTVDRIRRSTPKPANKLVKPIFMPEFCYPDIHRGTLRGSKSRLPANPEQLRMLHYWGARLQNWGRDTDHVLNITVPFHDMADTWVGKIRNSLLVFGENDTFSSQTGP